jgi:hypothetical protein
MSPSGDFFCESYMLHKIEVSAGAEYDAQAQFA